METVDNKYKKWGWGALIGLVAVIIVAGIAIGVSMSSKPVNVVDNGADSTKTVAENSGNNGSNKSTDEGRDNEADAKNSGSETGNTGTGNTGNTGNSGNAGNNYNFLNNNANNANNGANNNANNSSNMPKTGPEDDMIAFAAWAAIAGLSAYYFLNAKKNA